MSSFVPVFRGVEPPRSRAMKTTTAVPHLTDALLRVRGTVQGVGFRPFVYRTARQLGLRGWVCNDPQGVLIRAVGDPDAVAALVMAIEFDAPPAAKVRAVEKQSHPNDAPVGNDFSIRDSAAPAAAETSVPTELALCIDCRRELLDPRDRRHGYAFINCTQCGPRYSILENLPYDRPRTSMRTFKMCPDCQREYDDPASRRFHAQPNACPVCGPKLTLIDLAGNNFADGPDAIKQAADALCDGLIVAVKGLGGYHLMCDATSVAAVTELRRRKHREEKPLAVMFRDLAAVRAEATVSLAAASLLSSAAAPIVLLPRRAGGTLAYGIAPGNPWVGALLPYTPLHVLLLEEIKLPLVATSANLSEEPLCYENDEAHQRLFGIADLYLENNRPIIHPVDDSVMRLTPNGRPITVRRARGYAPSSLTLPAALPGSLLCVGAQMKSTVAVAAGTSVFLSPHLGDLGSLATQRVFTGAIKTLSGLHGAGFTAVAHDKHPDYSSTHFAQVTGFPRIAVQHHLAHVLACLLDNSHPADGVLGIAWDGTGYGEDGTVWGGEFILLNQGKAARFARLRPFRLPGGEAAVRDPRRVALSLAHEIGALSDSARHFSFSDQETDTLRRMLEQGLNSPVCSSAGRLFDAVGALLGIGRHNTFEGQIPLAVEAAAWPSIHESACLPLPVRPAAKGAVCEIDWQPMIEILLRSQGDPAKLAAAFHRGLAQAMLDVARQAGVGTVALTGGCFQNALLHDLARDTLTAAGFRVLTHHELSPNDGSIAAGQALGALWGLTSVTLP